MTLQEKVARGAKLLDEHGRWAHKIPTDTFDMESTCNCVLHHLYIDVAPDPLYVYTYGLCHLGLDDTFLEKDDFYFGFDCAMDDPDYIRWRSYWVDEIKNRLKVS